MILHDTRGRDASVETASGHRTVLLDAAVLLAFLFSEVAYLVRFVPDYVARGHGGDYPLYVQMAEALLVNSVRSPWKFRLLNPLLASIPIRLGTSPEIAFLIVCFASAFGACLLMAMYLRQLALSEWSARAGALLFAASVGGLIPLRRYYGYPDATTNLVILAVLICAASQRAIATAISLGLAALAKESALLLLPFLALRMKVPTVWWRRAAVLGVPVIVFVLLHTLISSSDPPGSSPLGFTISEQFRYWDTAMVHGAGRWVLWAFAYSMGPLWLIAWLSGARNPLFIKSFAPFLLVLGVPLLRTTDTERVLMLCFPVVFPLVGRALDECGNSRRRSVVAVVTGICTLGAQLTFDWAPKATQFGVNPKDFVFLSLCVIPVGLVFVCRSMAPTLIAAPLDWPAGTGAVNTQPA